MRLTISKLATAADVPPDTIRYYERMGLLPPTGRSGSGYRLYGEQTVERLRFIRGAQRVAFRFARFGNGWRSATAGSAHAGTPRSSSDFAWPSSMRR